MLMGMASFSEDQLARIETLLAENVGVASVTVGGRSVSYDDLLKQYDYWQARVARANGTRPRVSHINLGGF